MISRHLIKKSQILFYLLAIIVYEQSNLCISLKLCKSYTFAFLTILKN